MVKRKKATAKPKDSPSNEQPSSLTLMDHVQELRSRLFWMAVWFIAASCAILPFFNDVIKLLMRPLGNEKLYYLTPVGGLSFMIKVGMYLGLIATLPILLYHIYAFVAPAVRRHSARRVFGYTITSLFLAGAGVIFAYVVSLPSAMHFLTHVNIDGVSPMLTVDSYLSFIIAYLLAGALLFQLPLIMIIIDSVRPTPPSQWLKYERHVIVGAFIIAMLITPTPSVIDQVIMAVPMIVMYQVGLALIALRHRKKHFGAPTTTAPLVPSRTESPSRPATVLTQTALGEVPPVPSMAVQPSHVPSTRKAMDFTRAASRSTQTSVKPTPKSIKYSQQRSQLVIPASRSASNASSRPLMRRGIDGISVF